MNTICDTDVTVDLAGARAEAAQLLEELIAARAAAESRAAELGRRDPMKQVTGRSAYDAAILSTQDALARCDAALGARAVAVVADAPLITSARSAPVDLPPGPSIRPARVG